MRKVDLGQGNDIYQHDTNLSTAQGIEVRQTNFYPQVFAEDGKAVIMLSEMPENYSEPNMRPLEFGTSGVTYTMMDSLGYRDLNNIEVIYHQPENVNGNNPESFEKVNYYFDDNGLREHYRNPREELTAEQVAEKIGPENFVEKQFAQEATVKEEVSAQPDYARADLSSERVANDEASHQNLRSMANEAKNEYEPEF